MLVLGLQPPRSESIGKSCNSLFLAPLSGSPPHPTQATCSLSTIPRRRTSARPRSSASTTRSACCTAPCWPACTLRALPTRPWCASTRPTARWGGSWRPCAGIQRVTRAPPTGGVGSGVILAHVMERVNLHGGPACHACRGFWSLLRGGSVFLCESLEGCTHMQQHRVNTEGCLSQRQLPCSAHVNPAPTSKTPLPTQALGPSPKIPPASRASGTG